MSASAPMTCEHANELLTELVCGELDAVQEAEVRAHAAGCATCGPELAKFGRVLRAAESIPLDEPSPQVELRVMQAAREAVSRRAGAAQAIDSDSPVSAFRAWLDRLGSWAMSPQVAMASVLLLVVGIGLYALPLSQQTSAPAMLPLAEESDETAPPAASAAAAPAAQAPASPMAAAESDAPEEARRLGDEAAEKATVGLDSQRSRMASEKPRATSSGALSRPAKKMDALGSGRALDTSAEGAAGGSAGLGAARGRSSYAPPPPDDRAGGAKPSAPPAPAPYPKSEPARVTAAPELESAAPVAPAADALAEQPAGPAKEAAKGESAADEFGHMLDEGLSAARRGDHARAVELLEPVANKAPLALRASARPVLARSLRAQGLCARALPYYALLVKATSVTQATLLEAADCYERTGNVAMAQELRARLQPPMAKPAAEPTRN